MKNITNDYKLKIPIMGRQIDSKISYTIEGTTTELGKEQLNSVTPHYESQMLKSAMKQLDIDSNVDIPLNTTLNYQFGVKVDRYNLTEDETYQDNKNYYILNDDEYELLVKGTDYQIGDTITGDIYEYEEYEYINYGNYVVYSSEKQEDTNSYRIICYDKMLYSMVDYTKMNITYPITIRNYIQAICDTIGLNFKNANDEFANYDKEIQNELYFDAQDKSLGYKFRDVLDELAQVTGSTICINEETDELEIRYINEGVTYEETEGTTIDLEDSIKHKLSNSELKGNTTQQTYTGKNLLANTNVNSGDNNYWQQYSTFNQTTGELTRSTTSTSESFILHRINLKNNTTYTISCLAKSNGFVRNVDIYAIDNNFSISYRKTDINLSTSYTKQTLTFTTNSSTNFTNAIIRFDNNGSTTSGTEAILTIKDVMLVEGTNTDYEPYVGGIPSPNPSYPQAVNNVTGRQEIDIVGKNLFIPTLTNNGTDITKANCQQLSINDGEYSLNATGSDMYFGQVSNIGSAYTSDKGTLYKVNNADKIYLYLTNDTFNKNYITWYDENKVCLSYKKVTDEYVEPPAGTKYFTVRFGYGSAVSGTTYKTKVMVSYTPITEYEPYIGKQYEINLGKNLLDISDITTGGGITNNGDGSITLNGTISGGTSYSLTKPFILYANKVYTLSLTNTNSDYAGSTFILRNGTTNKKSIELITSSTTWTPTEDMTIDTLRIYGGDNTFNNFTFSVQLEDNDHATSYSAYKTPIELCKIGDYQDYIRKSTGKNLFDYSNNTLENMNINNNTMKITSDNSCKLSYIKCKPNTTYTISRRNPTTNRFQVATTENIPEVDSTLLSYVGTANTSDMYFTITTPSNANYIVVRFIYNQVSDYEIYAKTIQIEEGTQATEYEPYGKIWYVYKKIDKVILTGNENENWVKNTSYTNNTRFTGNATFLALGTTTNLYSNYFVEGTGGTDTTNIDTNGNTGQLMVTIPNTIATDVSAFKTWLSTHNTEVYYSLANSTTTIIDDTELINQLEALNNVKTYDGITYITVDGDLPSTLKISYANGYDLDTINEEYFKDTNVNFGEKYGPINSIVLSRSAGADNVYLRDEESIAEDGLHELKISDNQIMNFNDRSDYLPDLLKQLGGLEYYLNDYVSTGITYYEMCDRYFAQIGDTKYSCVMFNDEILVTQGLVENIHTDMQEESETDYSKADKTDRRINQTNLIVNKQTGDIEALTTKTEEIEEDLSENYYTKETTNQLIQNAETGVTNTFSEAGGNNILRNTNFSATEVLEEGQQYEYWYGNVVKTTNNNSANGMSILLQNGNLYQEQQVANGTYTVSFYYKKLNPLATGKLVVNGTEYALTEDDYTLFQTGLKDEVGAYITQPIIANDNYLKVQFTSDTNNGFELYDIMCNFGTVKLAYSQNQNETITNTVNISKGITITASDKDVKFVATPDGIRIKNKDTDEIITDFTDKGMDTKNAIIEETATIVGIYRQKVDDQVWDSLM